MRGYRLGSQSLWIDEVFTLNSSGVGTPFHPADLLGDIHGALYSLVLHGCSRLLGDSEAALRLPSMLFGVALVPAMAMLAGAWIGARAVKPAAWLTALSPFLVWYSQEARNYMLLMLCVCLSSVALLRLREQPTRARAAVWLGATWAGLLSNFSFALLGPLQLGWWMTAKTTPARRLSGAAIAGATLLVLMSPWVLKAVQVWDFQRLGAGSESAAAPLRGRTTFHPAAYPFALHAFAVGYTLGPPLRELRTGNPASTLARHGGEIAAVVLVFGTLGVTGLAALRRRGRLLEAGLWLVVPALLVSYFAARNFKTFNPRYLAVCMPAFLLVLAAGFADLRRRWAIAAALAIAVLWGISLAHHYFVPAYGKEDYRGTAALLRTRGHDGERVLALGASEPVFYYYRGPLPALAVWLGYASSDPARLESKLAVALAGATGAWLVLSRPEELDPHEAFAGWMGRRFPGAEPVRLEGVRVWHLDREDVGRLDAAARH